MKSKSIRRSIVIGIMICGAVGSWYWHDRLRSLEPVQADPEISRMIQVLEKLRQDDFQVNYDGYQHPQAVMHLRAKQLVRERFQPGMKAEEWVEKNVYRTDKGELIYFVYPDGRRELAKDRFLRELQKTPPEAS